VLKSKLTLLFSFLSLLPLLGIGQFNQDTVEKYHYTVTNQFGQWFYEVTFGTGKFSGFDKTETMDTLGEHSIELSDGSKDYTFKGGRSFLNNYQNSLGYIPYRDSYNTVYLRPLVTSDDSLLVKPTVGFNHSFVIAAKKGESLSVKGLRIFNFQADQILINSIKEYHFYKCTIDSARFENDTLELGVFNGCRANKLIFEHIAINGLAWVDAKIDSLQFENCKFLQVPKISSEQRPDCIIIKDCDLTNFSQLWDIDQTWEKFRPGKCLLSIKGTDISKLKFVYSNYILDTAGLNFETLESFYNKLKEQYTNLGMTSSYDSADIDSRRFIAKNRGALYKFTDWVNRWWWNYGYDKGKVVTNSLFLFSFFLFANLCFGLKRLFENGYELNTFRVILDQIKKYRYWYAKIWYQFWYTFLFTCLVFWGIKLERDKLKLQNLGYIFYILLQYLVGVVCLAYLAAFILGK